MIILRSPKGWTGPKVFDGLQIEGSFRAHQVSLIVDRANPEHVKQLESWMKSYRPEELFDERGRLIQELVELVPEGDRRMGANPHAKWLKVTSQLPWRRKIASLNYLLVSHVWQPDHNGFTHQDPGFIDHVVNKKADIVRVYLPPDAKGLLSVLIIVFAVGTMSTMWSI
jgi:phosphoketolase